MKPIRFALTLVAFAMAAYGCGSKAGEEPAEAQMREAALFAINHPPGIANSSPITIQFFKKEACDSPTPQGYNCRFDWQVASANLGASMYNNVPSAYFYMDKSSGKWAMRPPF